MNMSLSLSKQIRPLLQIPTIKSQLLRHRPQKEKVVVVMGATGAGKSRLSIDLATRFAAEVINSDKIQVYRGLDIATNKITDDERRGVPHHLLGTVDPESDFSAGNFRAAASLSLRSITGRGRLPIIVGGSNSFIEALVDPIFRSKYACCFLWVDVAMPVLHSAVSERVDEMVERGIVDEVRDFFKPDGDYTRGIWRAIGVPEFDKFFRSPDEILMAAAIDAIKTNTSRLACRQLEKIHRLRNLKGWRLHRLDATEVFRNRGRREAAARWEEVVAGPGAALVERFLYSVEAEVGAGLTEVGRRAWPMVATASV